MAKIGLGIFHPIEVFYNTIQIKTFEYMLYGLPIICSNFGYINKFVTESQSGIPVNPLNSGEIADAVIKLLTQTDLYNKLSQNGKHVAQTRYNWKSEEVKLVNIYNKLLSIEN